VNYDVNLTFEGDPALAAQWAGFAKKKSREFGVFCGRSGQTFGTKWYDITPDVRLKVRYSNGIQYAHITAGGYNHYFIFRPATSRIGTTFAEGGWGTPFIYAPDPGANEPMGTLNGAWKDILVTGGKYNAEILIDNRYKLTRGDAYPGKFGRVDTPELAYGNSFNWLSKSGQYLFTHYDAVSSSTTSNKLFWGRHHNFLSTTFYSDGVGISVSVSPAGNIAAAWVYKSFAICITRDTSGGSKHDRLWYKPVSDLYPDLVAWTYLADLGAIFNTGTQVEGKFFAHPDGSEAASIGSVLPGDGTLQRALKRVTLTISEETALPLAVYEYTVLGTFADPFLQTTITKTSGTCHQVGDKAYATGAVTFVQTGTWWVQPYNYAGEITSLAAFLSFFTNSLGDARAFADSYMLTRFGTPMLYESESAVGSDGAVSRVYYQVSSPANKQSITIIPDMSLTGSLSWSGTDTFSGDFTHGNIPFACDYVSHDYGTDLAPDVRTTLAIAYLSKGSNFSYSITRTLTQNTALTPRSGLMLGSDVVSISCVNQHSIDCNEVFDITIVVENADGEFIVNHDVISDVYLDSSVYGAGTFTTATEFVHTSGAYTPTAAGATTVDYSYDYTVNESETHTATGSFKFHNDAFIGDMDLRSSDAAMLYMSTDLTSSMSSGSVLRTHTFNKIDSVSSPELFPPIVKTHDPTPYGGGLGGVYDPDAFDDTTSVLDRSAKIVVKQEAGEVSLFPSSGETGTTTGVAPLLEKMGAVMGGADYEMVVTSSEIPGVSGTGIATRLWLTDPPTSGASAFSPYATGVQLTVYKSVKHVFCIRAMSGYSKTADWAAGFSYFVSGTEKIASETLIGMDTVTAQACVPLRIGVI
jgi:hypothetical protein